MLPEPNCCILMAPGMLTQPDSAPSFTRSFGTLLGSANHQFFPPSAYRFRTAVSPCPRSRERRREKSSPSARCGDHPPLARGQRVVVTAGGPRTRRCDRPPGSLGRPKRLAWAFETRCGRASWPSDRTSKLALGPIRDPRSRTQSRPDQGRPRSALSKAGADYPPRLWRRAPLTARCASAYYGAAAARSPV